MSTETLKITTSFIKAGAWDHNISHFHGINIGTIVLDDTHTFLVRCANLGASHVPADVNTDAVCFVKAMPQLEMLYLGTQIKADEINWLSYQVDFPEDNVILRRQSRKEMGFSGTSSYIFKLTKQLVSADIIEAKLAPFFDIFEKICPK